jgi:hypothetical protein
LDRLEAHERETIWPAMIEDACLNSPAECFLFFASWARSAPDSAKRRSMLEEYRARPDRSSGLRAEIQRELDLLLAGNTSEPERVSYSYASNTSNIFARLYHHAIPFPLDRVDALWRRCEDAVGEEKRCRRGAEKVSRSLGTLH